MSQVLFLPARADEEASQLGRKVCRLFERLALLAKLPPGAQVAVKIHIGEEGRPAPIPPAWIRPLIDRLAAAGTLPFLTDTCTLYRGRRSNATAHLNLAAERGFDPAGAGAPFLVADGLLGAAAVEVPVAGHHFQSVQIAAAVAQATALVACNHFTGHLGTGFGAAIKNLGMGLAARAGKLQQHAVSKPTVRAASCTGCADCVEVCPGGAITILEDRAEIDPELCIGCGQCLTVCFAEAIRGDYDAGTRLLQERMVEHAVGAVAGFAGRCAYLTFLVKVTANCDCIGQDEPPLFPDIGLLAAADPVAIDQAACDLVAAETGRPINSWCHQQLDPRWQLRHAEALGLGSRRYDLVRP